MIGVREEAEKKAKKIFMCVYGCADMGYPLLSSTETI